MANVSSMEKHYKLISILCKLKPEDRQEVMRYVDSSVIESISICVANVIDQRSSLNLKKRRKLHSAIVSEQRRLRYIARKSNSLANKKKYLLQVGGGTLTQILRVAVPLMFKYLAGSDNRHNAESTVQ